MEATIHMPASGMHTERYPEGPIARTIEQRTAKLPSDTFLWAAIGSIAISLVLRFIGKKNDAVFVGEWVPTFLLFGIYNKMVKLHGVSDHLERGMETTPVQ